MGPNLEPLALSPAAAGRFLGVSKRQIYLLLAAGSIRARKLGRSTLVDVASLRDYFATLPGRVAGVPLFPDASGPQRLRAPILRRERRDHQRALAAALRAAAAEAKVKPEQVLDLLRRGYKRWQIATLCCISRARVTQILNGRNGKPGVMPRPTYNAAYRAEIAERAHRKHPAG